MKLLRYRQQFCRQTREGLCESNAPRSATGFFEEILLRTASGDPIHILPERLECGPLLNLTVS